MTLARMASCVDYRFVLLLFFVGSWSVFNSIRTCSAFRIGPWNQKRASPISLVQIWMATHPDNESPKRSDESSGEESVQASAGLEKLALELANGKFQNIVIVQGAGVSVNAGIPDFRTPGTGLYSKLEEYQLPYPEAIFELDYYRENPFPFMDIARAIWPGQEGGPKPTPAHYFATLLHNRGMLRRVYTQNIDGLESMAGLPDSHLIECHGHFRTSSCINPNCPGQPSTKGFPSTLQTYQQKETTATCEVCQSLIKPDVVFFGEELPDIFIEKIHQDMEKCDLLVVMGTSLLVAPVASIPHWVGKDVPRLLVNRDLVGAFAEEALWRIKHQNGAGKANRDVFQQGDCDEGVATLCKLAGPEWSKEFSQIQNA